MSEEELKKINGIGNARAAELHNHLLSKLGEDYSMDDAHAHLSSPGFDGAEIDARTKAAIRKHYEENMKKQMANAAVQTIGLAQPEIGAAINMIPGGNKLASNLVSKGMNRGAFGLAGTAANLYAKHQANKEIKAREKQAKEEKKMAELQRKKDAQQANAERKAQIKALKKETDFVGRTQKKWDAFTGGTEASDGAMTIFLLLCIGLHLFDVIWNGSMRHFPDAMLWLYLLLTIFAHLLLKVRIGQEESMIFIGISIAAYVVAMPYHYIPGTTGIMRGVVRALALFPVWPFAIGFWLRGGNSE